MAVTGQTDDIGASAMRKAMWRIVPLIGLAYLCAYIDRVNVSFAAQSMNEDLAFSATVYGLGGGLFFLAYALFEIPSNLLLVRFGARRWIARIMITWGLLSAAMMFVSTPWQFYTLRFLLGVAEAGFYPGVIYYFSAWFPPCHRSRAVSRFFAFSPLASVVLGAISGWLIGLDGTAGLHGWQWLFLVQGLPTVAVGFAVLAFLPDAPAKVSWLTPPEKAWIEDELAREQARIGEPQRHHVLAAFRNPQVLLLGLLGALLMASVTTTILNAPLVLAEMASLGQAKIGFLVSLGGVLGAGAVLLSGNFADRNGDRWGNAAVFTAIMAAALLVIGLAPGLLPTVAAYLVFATVCFTIPSLTSSGWAEVLHIRQLAVGAAAINTMSQIGAFVGPFAWGVAKDATGSFHLGLFGLALAGFIVVGLLLVIRHQVRGAHAAAAARMASAQG
jgi:ACS family tartrate transporter-like MFS transporter